jgi:hypothetical protein
MNTKFKLIIFTFSAFLISCSKDKACIVDASSSNNVNPPTAVTPTFKHSFKFTLNGVNGGAIGNNSFISYYPGDLASNGSQAEVFAVQKYNNGLSTYYIFASKKSNDCTGAFGKCYSISFSMPTLTVGDHNISNMSFYLQDAVYATYPFESYNLTIKEIGNIGGNIKGSFSGKFGKYHYWTDELLGVADLSGEFVFERLN